MYNNPAINFHINMLKPLKSFVFDTTKGIALLFSLNTRFNILRLNYFTLNEHLKWINHNYLLTI